MADHALPLTFKTTRTSQPQGCSQLTPQAHVGLRGFFDGRVGAPLVDVPTGNAIKSSAANTVCPHGKAIGQANEGYGGLYNQTNADAKFNNWFLATDNFTFAVCSVTGASGPVHNTAFGGIRYGIDFGTYYGNLQLNVNDGVSKYIRSGFYPGPNVLITQVAVIKDGFAHYYINGDYFGSVAISGPISQSTIYRHVALLGATGKELGQPGTAFWMGLWDGDVDGKRLSGNPWKIFKPQETHIYIPHGTASVTLPTIVYPDGTTSAGAWTATGAGSLHAAISEVTPSDTEYISVDIGSSCTFTMQEPAYPGTANQSLAYRAASTTSSTLTVRLFQGATTITERTHSLTSDITLYTQTLTVPEIALITAGPLSVTLTAS